VLKAVQPNTILVTVMHANNETGLIQVNQLKFKSAMKIITVYPQQP